MTREASDVKAARTFPCEEETEHSRDTQHWLEQRSEFKACNKHYIRPLDSTNSTVLSQHFRVCGVEQSKESGWQRVKGIQLRNYIVWRKGSESVKYCAQDQCQDCEPRVMNVWVQSYLLRVILEITVSDLFSLLISYSIISYMFQIHLASLGENSITRPNYMLMQVCYHHQVCSLNWCWKLQSNISVSVA